MSGPAVQVCMDDPWYGASDHGHFSPTMSAMAEFSCQKYRQRSQDSCPKFGYRRPQITTHQSDYKQFQKAELPKSQFTGPDTKELIIKKLARTGGKGPWRHFQETSGVRGENVQWIDGSRKIFDQLLIDNLPSSLSTDYSLQYRHHATNCPIDRSPQTLYAPVTFMASYRALHPDPNLWPKETFGRRGF